MKTLAITFRTYIRTKSQDHTYTPVCKDLWTNTMPICMKEGRNNDRLLKYLAAKEFLEDALAQSPDTLADWLWAQKFDDGTTEDEKSWYVLWSMCWPISKPTVWDHHHHHHWMKGHHLQNMWSQSSNIIAPCIRIYRSIGRSKLAFIFSIYLIMLRLFFGVRKACFPINISLFFRHFKPSQSLRMGRVMPQ